MAETTATQGGAPQQFKVSENEVKELYPGDAEYENSPGVADVDVDAALRNAVSSPPIAQDGDPTAAVSDIAAADDTAAVGSGQTGKVSRSGSKASKAGSQVASRTGSQIGASQAGTGIEVGTLPASGSRPGSGIREGSRDGSRKNSKVKGIPIHGMQNIHGEDVGEQYGQYGSHYGDQYGGQQFRQETDFDKSHYAFDNGSKHPFTSKQMEFLKKKKMGLPTKKQQHWMAGANGRGLRPASPNSRRLHESYEMKLDKSVDKQAEHYAFKPGQWEQKLLQALEKLENHTTRPRGVAEIRSLIKVLPETAVTKFISLCFNPRKPMSNPKSQREVLFFLPCLAERFPSFEKLQRAVVYVVSFLKQEKLHPSIARCIFETYNNMGGIPKNFPLICSSIFARCRKGEGRSLTERRGCVLVLQHLLAEIQERDEIDWRKFGFYILELLRTAHDLHDVLLVLVSQLLDIGFCVVSKNNLRESADCPNHDGLGNDAWGQNSRLSQTGTGRNRSPSVGGVDGRSGIGNLSEYQIFSKDDIAYLVATLVKHLSSQSAKPNVIDERSHVQTGVDVEVFPNADPNLQKPNKFRMDEFSLTRELAFAGCVTLGHLAKFYPDSCREYRTVVLGALDKDNINLHRLSTNGGLLGGGSDQTSNLRASIKYAWELWEGLDSKNRDEAEHKRTDAPTKMSHGHMKGSVFLSQVRQDELFSKKGLVGSIAASLIGEYSPTDEKLLLKDEPAGNNTLGAQGVLDRARSGSPNRVPMENVGTGSPNVILETGQAPQQQGMFYDPQTGVTALIPNQQQLQNQFAMQQGQQGSFQSQGMQQGSQSVLPLNQNNLELIGPQNHALNLSPPMLSPDASPQQGGTQHLGPPQLSPGIPLRYRDDGQISVPSNAFAATVEGSRAPSVNKGMQSIGVTENQMGNQMGNLNQIGMPNQMGMPMRNQMHPGMQGEIANPMAMSMSPMAASIATNPMAGMNQMRRSMAVQNGNPMQSMGMQSMGMQSIGMQNGMSPNMMRSRAMGEQMGGNQIGGQNSRTQDPMTGNVSMQSPEIRYDTTDSQSHGHNYNQKYFNNAVISGGLNSSGARPSAVRVPNGMVRTQSPEDDDVPFLTTVYDHLQSGDANKAFSTVFQHGNERTLRAVLKDCVSNRLDIIRALTVEGKSYLFNVLSALVDKETAPLVGGGGGMALSPTRGPHESREKELFISCLLNWLDYLLGTDSVRQRLANSQVVSLKDIFFSLSSQNFLGQELKRNANMVYARLDSFR